MTSESLYEVYHAACPFPHFGCDSFHADKAVAAYDDAKSVLDFGCGNGYAVKQMQSDGFDWSGVEVSKTAYEKHLQSPGFYLGTTDQFQDRQFDMTYSTEVLEHVPEETIAQVAADICRVTSKYIFMTISLRPSSDNNRYHCTLKSRAWWEDKFTSNGFVVDRPVIDCYQRRTLKSTKRIFGKYADLGPIPKGFAQQPPYELYGEKEFWFFAFRREGVAARPLPEPTVPWVNRKVVPALRRVMRAA
jgi:SAM-dependent methyltransferase